MTGNMARPRTTGEAQLSNMIWNWFKDEWLISRQAAKLVVATLLVLALIPVFAGRIDTNTMSFWSRES